MKSNVEVILISTFPLPYKGIGSWTKLYTKYILSNNHLVDYVICPTFDKTNPNSISQIDYYYYRNDNKFNKLFKKFDSQLKQIKQILKDDRKSKFVIHIIDNIGLVIAANTYLKKGGLRNRAYIQYSFHGFSFQSNTLMRKINTSCDELILLTSLSYIYNLKRHALLPKYVSVLNNGIDTKVFQADKSQLSKEKTTFLWCSQDRPKKGLHTILEIWPKFYEQYPDTELKIVGTRKHYEGNGINSLGRLPNDNLTKIYQSSHVYLFPTLWHEGFGLTLIEALHSDCFCIASNIGGVPEVLNHGEYGWLIDEPHNSEQWLKAMHKYMNEKPQTPAIPEDLYSLNNWIVNLNGIIANAKKRLEQKNF